MYKIERAAPVDRLSARVLCLDVALSEPTRHLNAPLCGIILLKRTVILLVLAPIQIFFFKTNCHIGWPSNIDYLP
jgi:hypothetical protein